MIKIRRKTTLVALTLGLGCSPVKSDTTAPTGAQQAERPPAKRSGDPEVADLENAIAKSVGAPVVVVASAPVQTTGAPFRELVLFKVAGLDYCSQLASPSLRTTCAFDGSSGYIPWEVEEHLGFALVDFAWPDILTVKTHRFLGYGSEAWSARVLGEPVGPINPSPETSQPGLGAFELGSFIAEDVDGDGLIEFSISLTYEVFGQDPLGPGTGDEDDDETFEIEDVYVTTLEQTRLLVVRPDDLSFELDLIVRQERQWDGVDDDRLSQRTEFVASKPGVTQSLVVEWCQVDAMYAKLPACELEVACATPTHRLEASYSRQTDTYIDVRHDALRKSIGEDADWEPIGCGK